MYLSTELRSGWMAVQMSRVGPAFRPSSLVESPLKKRPIRPNDRSSSDA
jgi:hypothetical protein